MISWWGLGWLLTYCWHYLTLPGKSTSHHLILVVGFLSDTKPSTLINDHWLWMYWIGSYLPSLKVTARTWQVYQNHFQVLSLLVSGRLFIDPNWLTVGVSAPKHSTTQRWKWHLDLRESSLCVGTEGFKMDSILLMAEILQSPVEVGSLSRYLLYKYYRHPRWCRDFFHEQYDHEPSKNARLVWPQRNSFKSQLLCKRANGIRQ